MNSFDTKTILHENFIVSTARAIAGDHNPAQLHFSQITSSYERIKLGDFRRETYQARKPYMISELNDQGLDLYDNHGTVYAVWHNNDIIASIRLCPYPFETSRFIDPVQLETFLGVGFQQRYLEWSRLVVRSGFNSFRLLPAIIIYAGMKTLASQALSQYFGYSTSLIRRLFSRFHLYNKSLEFTIPPRGEQKYFLLKGDFSIDLEHLAKKGFII